MRLRLHHHNNFCTLRNADRGVSECGAHHEPLATLMLALVRERRSHPITGAATATRWLFPGELPGRPISGKQLGERLRRHGIRPSQARSAALFQLATELPAAVLARMLGIHITSAVAWQRASSGDWAAYAAQVSQRPPRARAEAQKSSTP
jgi:hypothetical protein